MSFPSSSFTKVNHHAPYAAISPSRPELSQKGNTVLITGSSGGIGFAIARGFAKAGAAKVIMTARQKDHLDQSAATLRMEYPGTVFDARVVDVSNTDSIETLWTHLDATNIVVDVLVINAAHAGPAGRIVDLGYKKSLESYSTNLDGVLALGELFYNQKKKDPKTKLSLVNVSSCAIHDFVDGAAQIPSYGASKSAGTFAIQMLAKDVSADQCQVVSFHPGGIYTSAAKNAGYPKEGIPWDDEDLPGHYAVWAASNEAKFLHGRFTWAGMDVDELSNGEIRKRIDENPNLLKVGVIGL